MSSTNVCGGKQGKPLLIVGYALNAKKMRKSGHSDNFDSSLASTGSTSLTGSCDAPTTIPVSINSPPSMNPSTSFPSSSASPLLSSTSSSCDAAVSSVNVNNQVWRGGGLADILGDAKAIVEGVQFIQWDPEVPPSQQPCFDVIIHKLTEDLEKKDKDSIDKINALEAYLNFHRNCVIVDPLQSVKNVTSRIRTCERLRGICNHLLTKESCAGNGNLRENPLPQFSQPAFIVIRQEDTDDDILNRMKLFGLSFPVICKPEEACGTPNSHNMVVIVDSSDISILRNHKPCVMQQYYNHDGNFYKVYVVGEDVMVYRRPSLPNLDDSSLVTAGIKSVEFDSRYDYPTLDAFMKRRREDEVMHNPVGSSSIADSCSQSNSFDFPHSSTTISPIQNGIHSSLHNSSPPSSTSSISSMIDKSLFNAAASAIRTEFQLSLFGFDVIIPKPSPSTTSIPPSTLLIIDVNYFPSYKEVGDFPTRLRSFLKKRSKRYVHNEFLA